MIYILAITAYKHIKPQGKREEKRLFFPQNAVNKSNFSESNKLCLGTQNMRENYFHTEKHPLSIATIKLLKI